jgi:hypothetical protein
VRKPQGKRVALEEVIERVVVIPCRDQPNSTEIGAGKQLSTEGRSDRDVRVAQARYRRQPESPRGEAERRTLAYVGEM